MPRLARITGDSGIYHVMIRGINRRPIFDEDEDRLKFLSYLGAVRVRSGLTLYAYCLLDNHVHLLLEVGEEPLGLAMKRLGVRYVLWFNRKYGRCGHLFQDRFRSEPVDTDDYFIAVLRYIWRNPVEAGLCGAPVDYPWSSRRWLGVPGALVSSRDLIRRSGVTDLRSLDSAPPGAAGSTSTRQLWLPTGLSDRDAAKLIRQLTGIGDLDEFVLLPRAQQRVVVSALHSHGASARQLARLSSMPKTTIDRWIGR